MVKSGLATQRHLGTFLANSRPDCWEWETKQWQDTGLCHCPLGYPARVTHSPGQSKVSQPQP